MKRIALVLAVISAVQGAVEQFGKRVYFALPTARLTLDGKLDEIGWRRPRTLTGFVPYLTGELPHQTELRFLFDSRYLYIGARCLAGNLKALVVDQNDGGPLWRNDSIEIFLDPSHKHREYYQIVVNAIGKITILHPGGRDRTGPEDFVIAKAGREKNAWTLEVALSRRKFGISEPCPHSLGIAFLRDHIEGTGRVFTVFPPELAGTRQLRMSNLWAHLFLLSADNLSALKEEYRRRLSELSRITLPVDLSTKLSELKKSLPALKVGDTDRLLRFEKSLLSLESRVEAVTWRRKFDALFQEKN